MKLMIIFLTVAFLQVQARGLSQSVTLRVKNAPLAQVFREIEKQTGYVFVYGKSMLEKSTPVDLQVANTPLRQVLDLCFRNQGITYTIEDNKYIIVKPRPAPTVIKPAGSQAVADPVKGRVVGEDGAPLTGATVLVKGANTNYVTNNQGEFTINANEGDVLVVSFVGFESREIKLTKGTISSPLAVSLKPKRSLLDETVVIAYGTTSLRKSTGAVSSITSQEISKQPVANPLAALPGRISGAVIAQDNGMPGSAVKIQIRGQGSLSQGEVPLFIIDGVPFTNFNGGSPPTDNLNSFGISGANGAISPFSMINPNDIERIDVLKDADATSIYGSRGANGVIIITTKKGKAGKTAVNASFYQGTGKVSRFIPMLSLDQYLAMRREAFANSNQTPTAANAPDLKVWDTTKGTDWQKFLLGGTARNTDAQVGISGGAGGTRFLFNSAYHRETTVLPGNNESKRLSFRLNADHTTQDNKFNIGIMVSYSSDVTNLIGEDLSTSYNLPPNFPLYNPDGSLYWYSGYTNPLGRTRKPYKGIGNNLIGNLSLRYTILPGLNLKATLGYTRNDLDQKKMNPFSSDAPTSGLGSYTQFANNKTGNYIIEPTLDYTYRLGAGKITALAGASFQSSTAEGYSIYANNYSNEALLGTMMAAGTLRPDYNSVQRYKYAAGFGRLTYDYRGKYIVNANFRRDGSSRFAPANRFNNFGSVGAAWIFSEESFARNISFLSFGKLRGSIGTSGNDQISNYLYLNLYNAGTAFLGNGTLNPQPVLMNEDIKWESRRKYDIGIDLGFLKDRILLTASYYQTRSGNQISSFAMPGQMGLTTRTGNIPAVITNTGVELDLRTTNIKTTDLEWRTALNVTFNRNKLLKWPGLEKSFYASSYVIGQSLNVMQLYHFQGIDPATGIAQYEDKDGSGGALTSSGDRFIMPMGNPYYGGITNTVIYKGFQLDVTLQFNHRKGKTNLFPSSVPVGGMTNQTTMVLDRWMKPGDIAMYPAYKTTATDFNYGSSDVIYGDASFAKLRSASIAYAVPKNWIKRLKMADCTISVQGQNLFLFSKNKYLYDPETTFQGGPSGIGTGTLIPVVPPLRTIVFGINCSF